jgi:5-methylcytosine-specific restriction protein B
MLIEEINRGNPVQVFGELLTLIEAGKRSPRESLQLAYPRSGTESVHVPSNLYIIGTMNLADRSLAIMDLAFRRRFAFVSLEPSVNDAWQAWMSARHGVDSKELELVRFRFEALNDRIADDPALGSEFRLGHSFVTPPAEERVASFADWFRGVVDTEIVPTLEEYWFDDAAKAESASAALLEGLA